MGTTPFSKFIKCIRPLKENKESIEHFTEKIFEIYTPYTEEGMSDVERSSSTIKKYAYGSTNISKDVAIELLKYKDEQALAEFIDDTDDSICSAMYELFQSEFSIDGLNLFNLGSKAAELLTNILTDIATKGNKKSLQPINVEDYISKVKVENGMLVFGDAKIPMPISDLPSEDIPEDEMKLKYIGALIDAYNDAGKTDIDISNRTTFKKKYRDNFQEQRVNFYEAESLKNFSRDTISSESDEFQKLLDETYDGVISTSRKKYSDGYDRLLSVLEQAAKIELNGSKLYHLPELVTIKRKCGFCHMLVNDSRLFWVEEEEDE
ncbi:ABC-three component system protein [Allofustis seminis]|uniref:ABC-three component system protein n=1 Tax=Allofustis seminis TaxID=166939 RepID=UPI00036DF3C8|nr:ABC-three component system protein [Allofustis seminis]